MDYLGLMTRGVPTPPPGRLPFDDFGVVWRRTVLDACREAWRRLSVAAPAAGTPLTSFSEDQLTVRLKTILNEMRGEDPSAVKGFSSALFENVGGGVVAAHDGSSLEKRPDLVFRPIDTEPGMWLSEYRALFTECKIVDSGRHRIGLYCGKGIKRFVDGEYGWAMGCGLMIAYARQKRQVPTTLNSALKRERNPPSPDRYATRRLAQRGTGLGTRPVAYVSVHRRQWKYSNGDDPGNVDVVHLWLR